MIRHDLFGQRVGLFLILPSLEDISEGAPGVELKRPGISILMWGSEAAARWPHDAPACPGPRTSAKNSEALQGLRFCTRLFHHKPPW